MWAKISHFGKSNMDVNQPHRKNHMWKIQCNKILKYKVLIRVIEEIELILYIIYYNKYIFSNLLRVINKKLHT